MILKKQPLDILANNGTTTYFVYICMPFNQQ